MRDLEYNLRKESLWKVRENSKVKADWDHQGSVFANFILLPNSTEIGAGDVVWKSGYLIHFTQNWDKSLTMLKFSFLVYKLKMVSYRVVFKLYMIHEFTGSKVTYQCKYMGFGAVCFLKYI